MSLLDDFTRVSRRLSCPICSHPDWCMVSRDSETSPSLAICQRIESARRFGEAGWLKVSAPRLFAGRLAWTAAEARALADYLGLELPGEISEKVEPR